MLLRGEGIFITKRPIPLTPTAGIIHPSDDQEQSYCFCFFPDFFIMSHSFENKDDTVNQKTILIRFVLPCVCVLGLTGWGLSFCQDEDISVEELLNNLKTGHYSGKPIDLDLEEVVLETLFSHLEKSSGLSFELNPNIPMQFLAKKTYRFNQVPWDGILSLILREFHLEAIPMDGTVYIQPIEDNLMRIVR
jgi:hypothetical protein